MLDGFVGLVIGSFQLAIRPVIGMGLVVEATVGDWPAEALVEEQEQKCDLHTLGGEPISVAVAVALKQIVALQLAEVVAELVQSVGFG